MAQGREDERLDLGGVGGVNTLEADSKGVLKLTIIVAAASQAFTQARIKQGFVERSSGGTDQDVAEQVEGEHPRNVRLLAEQPTDGNHALFGRAVVGCGVGLLGSSGGRKAWLTPDL